MLHIVRDGRWRWSVLLGVGFALVIFGGAPEAMLDEVLLIAVYAAVSAGFDRARWWRVLTRCGTGATLALGLAAAQWLPGITAIANSQRSGLGSSFTGSGSFPPAYSLLSLVPYLYGGFGHLGEAMFFSHYNLPEVEIYMGILPVIALLTLWRPHWPSQLAARERMTWYVVGLIGLLLAFGANTPLEHLFNAIPLYGRQRLQSRNMIDVVVATCVLFAGWIDRRGNVRDRSVTFDRRIALIPLSLVLALAGWALVAPASLVTTLSSGSGSPAEAHTVREATLIALGFCAAAAIIVWLRPLLRRRRWLLLVSAFTVLDLGLVAGTSGLVTLPSNALVGGTTPVESHVAADLTSGGRFDVFDPQRYGEGPGEAAAGLPDDNVVAQLPSVGGYASIVNGAYDARHVDPRARPAEHRPPRGGRPRRSRPPGDRDRARVLPAARARDADHVARRQAGGRGAGDGPGSPHGHTGRCPRCRLPRLPRPPRGVGDGAVENMVLRRITPAAAGERVAGRSRCRRRADPIRHGARQRVDDLGRARHGRRRRPEYHGAARISGAGGRSGGAGHLRASAAASGHHHGGDPDL